MSCPPESGGQKFFTCPLDRDEWGVVFSKWLAKAN